MTRPWLRALSFGRILIASLLLVASIAIPAGAQEVPEMSLSFDSLEWVNTISGHAAIVGTIECSIPVQDIYIEVTVSQDDEDRAGQGETTVDCNGATRWMQIVRGYEDYEAGPAAIEGRASATGVGETERSDTTTLVSCTRIGTLEDDSIRGTRKDDKVCALDGDDQIAGRSGTDKLRGGEGDDSLEGGLDDDVLLGGAGNDHLFGQDGDDKLDGNEGNDRLDGGAGKDSCSGGPGSNRRRNC
jgi:hypothetical protein